MTNLPLHQKGIVRNFVWIINLILLRIQKRIPKISQKDLSSKYDIGKATICNIVKREENIGSKRKRYVSTGKFSDLNHVFEMQVSPWMPRYLPKQKTRMMTFLSMNSSNIYKWPVCFTGWYRGIWWQFDNRINFRWWMGIRLASEIYSRYHFVAIAWQWNRQWRLG